MEAEPPRKPCRPRSPPNSRTATNPSRRPTRSSAIASAPSRRNTAGPRTSPANASRDRRSSRPSPRLRTTPTSRRTSSTSRRERRRADGVPVNPLGAGIPAPNIAAMIAQELAALAADAQTLATQLLPGDVIAAMVLPSNGLTDLLDIGGLRVAAELPPTVLPGETITVMVTGFEGERINLQIVPAAQVTASERTTVPVPASAFRSAGSAFAPGFTPTPLLTPADGRTPRPAPVAAPAPASAERTPPNSIARTAPTLPPPARTTGP